jgi:PAS domain S-box-containing protein
VQIIALNTFYSSWWFIILAISLFFAFFIFLFKKSITYNKDFVKDYTEGENNISESRTYFLILGLLFPLTEIFMEIYKVRVSSELFSNIVIGLLFLSLYFICKFNNFLSKNINTVFIVVFLMIASFTFYKSIFLPFELITFSEFLIILFFSYGVFKKLNYFLLFNTITFVVFLGLLFTNILEFKLILIYLNAIVVLSVLNYIRHLVVLNSKEKFVFANNIVNNGNSLAIGTNKFGELSYCSKNITKILGYTVDEVMGMNFWRLTQDEEFEYSDYSEKFVPNKVYTRKLKCKNGEYKYIQWTDTKYSDDLYVGIGQDVTERVYIQEQYKNIIQNATDIIYETDKLGNFIFINSIVSEITDFKIEELLGKHFTTLVKKDHLTRVARFYYKLPKDKNSFDILEFPIIGKNGKELWVSQKVSVKRDDTGVITNYTAIVRDITKFKQAEIDKIKRHQKANSYNLTLTQLATNPNLPLLPYQEILNIILEKASKVLEIEQISVWNLENNNFECVNLYNVKSNEYSQGFLITHSECPIYYNALKTGKILIANNVCENKDTIEFCEDTDYPLKSLLDVPIFLNGELTGIVCFEMIDNFKKWDDEDISFARSIAEVVSISIESQKRQQAEQAIKESEQNFRLLNETIDDVFWLCDLTTTKIIYISPSSTKVLGVTPQDFYTTNNYWINYIFDEDKELILEAHKQIEINGFYEVEYRIKTSDGLKWIHEKSFGVKDENGIYTKSTGICSDITEKKNAEIQLKQLSIVAEKTSNGILIADKDGNTIWANEGFLNMFEIELDKLIGKRPRDLFNADKTNHNEEADNLNANDFTLELKVITSKNNVKWVELNSTKIKDVHGNTLQQIEVLTDITEKVKARKDLEYQSILQKKIINAQTYEDLALDTLSYIANQTIDCCRISIYQIDAKQLNFSGYTLIDGKLEKTRVSVDATKNYEILKTGTSIIEQDLSQINTELKVNGNDEVSFIILPIIINSKLIGKLHIGFNKPFHLSDNEISNLESFTSLLSVAIQQIDLKNDLIEKNKDTIDSLNYAQNIQQTILPQIKKMTNTFKMYVYILNQEIL